MRLAAVPFPNSHIFEIGSSVSAPDSAPPSYGDDAKDTQPVGGYTQWINSGNGIYRPASATIPHIPAGAYGTDQDNRGIYLQSKHFPTDNILELPGFVNNNLLDTIQIFWDSRDRYERLGLMYKTGVLLDGPPGGGKTSTLHMLSRDIIKRGGVVIYCSHPEMLRNMLRDFRLVEPVRPLILVFEDMDEIIEHYGEHHILSILDGEHQTDNVLSIATTNYPDKLGARITNRPARFDRRITVGMPSEEARMVYLRTVTKGQCSEEDLQMWTRDTRGMSIAHLRELVAATLCLGDAYPDVIKRLRDMGRRPKTADGFSGVNMGLVGRLQE